MRCFTILFVLSVSILSGQKITVLDVNQDPIENVNFKSGDKLSISNKEGIVDISSFNHNESIEITHIGYNKKIIIKDSFNINNIILIRKSTIIQEISIHSSLNTNQNKSQIISLDKKEVVASLPSNSANLIQRSTSIPMQKSQVAGGSPNIRGFEANRILLVLDGIKLNNTIYRSGHLQNILSIDPYIIEKLNVIHGTSSIFYGSGSLGGAIIMETIDPKKDETNMLFVQHFESSSNNMLTHFGSSYSINNISSYSSISLKKNENLKMGKIRFHNYNEWGKDLFATKNNEQLFGNYHQLDITQKINVHLKNKNKLKFNYQISNSSKSNRYDKLNDLSDGLPKYKNWYYGPQKRELISLGYIRNSKSFLYDKINVLAALQNIKESRNTQKQNDSVLTKRLENLNIYALKCVFHKSIYSQKISFGAESRYENLKSKGSILFENGTEESYISRYPDENAEERNVSFYINSEVNLSKIMKWYSGIRGDINKINCSFTEAFPINLPNNNVVVENKNISMSTNISADINNSIFCSLSIFNAFRNPNIDDIGKLFSKTNGIVVIPNSNLRPEKNMSSEIVIKYIKRNTKLKSSLFYSKLTDVIEKRPFSITENDSILYDGEMMLTIANVNIKEALLFGFNMSYHQKISSKIDFQLMSDFVKSKSYDSMPLAHIPPFSLKTIVNYSNSEKSKLSLIGKYNSWKKAEDFDVFGVDNLDEATINGTPSWWILNLLYSHNLDDSLKISMSIENLFDAHYKTFASGISASGRNFVLNLQYNL